MTQIKSMMPVMDAVGTVIATTSTDGLMVTCVTVPYAGRGSMALAVSGASSVRAVHVLRRSCLGLLLLIAVACPGVVMAKRGLNVAATRTAKFIDAILYSKLSNEDRLIKLQAFLEPMQSMDDVKKKLELRFCISGGPGVLDCRVANSGLTIVFDPDRKLRLIRRDARVVHGVAYAAKSITEQGFEWHGYRRWYED